MTKNTTLLATEVLDLLKIDFNHLRELIDSGDLTPVYVEGTSPFNVRAMRFLRKQIEGFNGGME